MRSPKGSEELMRDGVRTMIVCPGYVKTGFQKNVRAGPNPESERRAPARDHAGGARRRSSGRGARCADGGYAPLGVAAGAGDAAVSRAGGIAHGADQRNGMILKLKRTPGIYVVGFERAGQSTVGRHLAHRLGWSFFDSDAEIEQAEKAAIGTILEERGEVEFRRIETEIIRQHVRWIERGRPAVLALGGEAVAQPGNRLLLEENGISVWLDCPLALVQQRAALSAHRPARDPESFAAHYHARRADYRLADVHIAIERRSRYYGGCDWITRFSNEHGQSCGVTPQPSSGRRWRRPTPQARWAPPVGAELCAFRNIYVIGAGCGRVDGRGRTGSGKRITAGLINVKTATWRRRGASG